MRKVKVSAIQIKVSNCLEDNLKKVDKFSWRFK